MELDGDTELDNDTYLQDFPLRFTPSRLLKKGSGFVTWSARDHHDGATVVVKLALTSDLTEESRFHWAGLCSKLTELKHPAVVSLLAHGQRGKVLYSVAPAVAEPSLEEILKSRTLNSQELLSAGRSLIEAMQALHQAGVCCRYLKPSRLFGSADGTLCDLRLLEYGLGRGELAAESLFYMAPELTGGLRAEVGIEADLYSLGCVLFQAAHGSPPFKGSKPGEIMRAHLNDAIPSLGALFPRGLTEVLTRLLHKEPKERYRSSTAVIQDLALLEAKGEEAIPSSELRRNLTQPALVARSEELAVLRRALRDTWEGRGGVVMVMGAAGMGKTRLVEELLRELGDLDLLLLMGRSAGRPLTALAPLGDALRRLLSETDSAWIEALRGRLGGWSGPVLEALPELAPLLGEPKRGGPETYGEERVRDGLSHLLDAIGTAQRPALIVLDDAHQADPSLAQLMENWSAREVSARHTLVLIASRVVSDSPWRTGLTLSLGPLQSESVGAIVHSMLGPASAEARELMIGLADGNPFLVIELLRGLVESGALQTVGGLWSLAQTSVESLRISYRGGLLLRQRLRALPADTMRCLELAAVLGSAFRPVDVVALEPDERKVSELLQLAQSRCLLWKRPESDELAFAHDLLREEILGHLEPERRAKLHEMVARYLSQQEGVLDSVLAHHFSEAGRKDLAAPYASKAAELAKRRYALEVAEGYYRIALQGSPGEVEVLAGLADVLRLSGKYPEAQSHYQSLLSREKDPELQATILGHLGDLSLKQSDLSAAGAYLSQALNLLGVRVPSSLLGPLGELLLRTVRRRGSAGEADSKQLLAISLLDKLGYVLFYQGSVMGPLWTNLKSMNLAEGHSPTPGLGHAYALHACLLSYVPWLSSRADRYSARAEALQSRYGDRWDLACALGRRGYVQMVYGSLKPAVENLEKGVEYLAQTGDKWELVICRYNLAYALYLVGKLEEARDLAHVNLQESKKLGDRIAIGGSLRVLVRLGGRLPPGELEEYLRADDGEVIPGILSQEILGLSQKASGELEAAAQSLQTALELAKKGGMVIEVATLTCELAGVYRLLAEKTPLHQGAERNRWLSQSQKLCRKSLGPVLSKYPTNLPKALRENAMLAFARGRDKEGRKLLERSLTIARDLMMRREEGLGERLWGQIGRSRAWLKAQEREWEGLALLREVGAHWELPTKAQPILFLQDRLDQLYSLGKRLAEPLQADEIVHTTGQAVRSIIPCDHCQILQPWDSSIEPGWRGHQPMIWSRQEMEQDEFAQASGCRSLMTIPLWARDRPVACLRLSHGQVSGAFAEPERQLAAYIATLAGSALEMAYGIEERERLMAALERSWRATVEQGVRMRDVFSGVGVGIALLDPSTRIQETNPALCEWLGEDLDNQRFLKFVYQAERSNFLEKLAELFEGVQEGVQLEVRLYNRRGGLSWCNCSLSLTSAGHDLPTLAIMALSDVSDRRLKAVALFQETERKLLSAELHDVFAQPLVGLSFCLQTLAEVEHPDLPGQVRAAAAGCRNLVKELGAMAFDLRNPVVEGLDLCSSIRAYVLEYSRAWGLEVKLSLDHELQVVRGLSSVFLYRIVQESLTNARRHGAPQTIWIRLKLRPDSVWGWVKDDGHGFDMQSVSAPGTQHRGFGLRGMRERVELLGGWLRVRSRPQGGTRLLFGLAREFETETRES